ncbi:MAG: hypothetical protein HY329_10420 [Chloroflexi bacterium]|nr:hypothetical protein [Chloroflexota bacterium]
MLKHAIHHLVVTEGERLAGILADGDLLALNSPGPFTSRGKSRAPRAWPPWPTSTPEHGPIATPSELVFVPKLPKTRSGKIMRRLLKAQELGLDPGDVTTLEE